MNTSDALPVIVKTPSGELEGGTRGGVCVFKGIPFATARRWRPGKRVMPWPFGLTAPSSRRPFL